MLNLIVAPNQQNSKAEKQTKKVVKILKTEKIDYSVYFSMSFADATSNIQQLTSSGETEFVLIGGDLLLHTFINTVKDLSKIKIGLIPTGNYTDFADYLAISKNPVEAIKNILSNNVVTIDYLLLNNTTKVANNITLGASTEMFEIYKQYKMQNALSKRYLMFKYGNKFEGIELAFNQNKNNKPKYENIFELSIANGGLLHGKHLSPLSNIKDGLFNLNYAIVPEKSERKKYLKMFKNGKQIYSESTKQLWQNQVRITNADKRIKILADGNLMTLEELNVQVIENGLNIYKK